MEGENNIQDPTRPILPKLEDQEADSQARKAKRDSRHNPKGASKYGRKGSPDSGTPSVDPLKAAYEIAKGKGFKRDINEFAKVMATNDQAVTDIYKEVARRGYKKSEGEFRALLGVKKKSSAFLFEREDAEWMSGLQSEQGQREEDTTDPGAPPIGSFKGTGSAVKDELLRLDSFDYDPKVVDLYRQYREAGLLKPSQREEIQNKVRESQLGKVSLGRFVQSHYTNLLLTGQFQPAVSVLDAEELAEARMERNKVDFLRDLSEEDRGALNDFLNTAIPNMVEENKNLMAEKVAIEQSATALSRKLLYLSEGAERIKEKADAQGGLSPEDLEGAKALQEDFGAIKEELEDLLYRYNQNNEIIYSNADDVGEFSGELAMLKKDYGGLDYLSNLVELTSAQLIGGAQYGITKIEAEAQKYQPVALSKLKAKFLPTVQEAKEFNEGVEDMASYLGPTTSIEDVDGVGSFGRWAMEQIATQLPVLASLSFGHFGLIGLGFSSGGSKLAEIDSSKEQAMARVAQIDELLLEEGLPEEVAEDLEYEKLDLQNNILSVDDRTAALVAIGSGLLEYGTERVSLGILKKGGARAWKALKKGGGKINWAKELGIWGVHSQEEGFSESINQFGNNLLDIFLLGEDKSVFDGVPDAYASGTFMGGVMTATPTLSVGLVQGLLPTESVKDMDAASAILLETASVISENEGSLDPKTIEILKNRAAKQTAKIKKKMEQALKNREGLSEYERKALFNLAQKAESIRIQVLGVKKAEGMSDSSKAEVLNELRDEAKKVSQEKGEILKEVKKRKRIKPKKEVDTAPAKTLPSHRDAEAKFEAEQAEIAKAMAEAGPSLQEDEVVDPDMPPADYDPFAKKDTEGDQASDQTSDQTNLAEKTPSSPKETAKKTAKSAKKTAKSAKKTAKSAKKPAKKAVKDVKSEIDKKIDKVDAELALIKEAQGGGKPILTNKIDKETGEYIPESKGSLFQRMSALSKQKESLERQKVSASEKVSEKAVKDNKATVDPQVAVLDAAIEHVKAQIAKVSINPSNSPLKRRQLISDQLLELSKLLRQRKELDPETSMKELAEYSEIIKESEEKSGENTTYPGGIVVPVKMPDGSTQEMDTPFTTSKKRAEATGLIHIKSRSAAQKAIQMLMAGEMPMDQVFTQKATELLEKIQVELQEDLDINPDALNQLVENTDLNYTLKIVTELERLAKGQSHISKKNPNWEKRLRKKLQAPKGQVDYAVAMIEANEDDRVPVFQLLDEFMAMSFPITIERVGGTGQNFEEVGLREYRNRRATFHYSAFTLRVPFRTNAPNKHFSGGGNSNVFAHFRLRENLETGEVFVEELQSDLFQESRRHSMDKIDLVPDTVTYMGKERDQFLKFMLEDSRWVRSMVHGIIQHAYADGTVKTVYFPRGETAAKVQGHQPYSEKKKGEVTRLASAKKALKLLGLDSGGNYKFRTLGELATKIENSIEDIYAELPALGKAMDSATSAEEKRLVDNEIVRLENKLSTLAPLDNVLSFGIVEEMVRKHGRGVLFEKDSEEGFGTYDDHLSKPLSPQGVQIALDTLVDQARVGPKSTESPIEAFYENRVFDTLMRDFGATRHKDEFGYGWIKVDLSSPKVQKKTSRVRLQQGKNGGIRGQAFLDAMKILIDPTLQTADTLPHEYAHFYIDMFKDTDIVKEAIKKFGTEEALVEYIGKKSLTPAAKEAKAWWKQFSQFLKDLFNNLPDKTKQELGDALTGAFLNRTDLDKVETLQKFQKQLTDGSKTKKPKAKPRARKPKPAASTTETGGSETGLVKTEEGQSEAGGPVPPQTPDGPEGPVGSIPESTEGDGESGPEFQLKSRRIYAKMPFAGIFSPTSWYKTFTLEDLDQFLHLEAGTLDYYVNLWEKRLINRFAIIARVQDTLEDRYKERKDEFDFNTAEILYHGKVAVKLAKKEDQLIEFSKKLRRVGIGVNHIGGYLYALHAPERNDYIRSLGNPGKGVGMSHGSGMSYALAEAIRITVEEAQSELDLDFLEKGLKIKGDKEYFQAFRKGFVFGNQEVYQELRQEIRDVMQETRDIMEEGGLIDAESAFVFSTFYENYVPLMGFEHSQLEKDFRVAFGHTMGIKGNETRRASGRESFAKNPMVTAFAMRNNAIIRAEKNKVTQVLLNIVREHPEIGQVFSKEKPDRTIRVNSKGKREFVNENMGNTDKYIPVKENGIQYYILPSDYNQYSQESMVAKAMSGLDVERANFLVKALSWVNRQRSKVLTKYNPAFIALNLFRDAFTALPHIGNATQIDPNSSLYGIDSKKLTTNAMKNIPRAWRAVAGAEYGKDAQDREYREAYEQLRELGGVTEYFHPKDASKMEKELYRMARIGKTPKDIVKDFLGLTHIENINTAVEVGVRLSAFREAVKLGATPKDAAKMAKELTINFNQKGEWTSVLNGLFIFFSAGVNGIQNMMKNILAYKKIEDENGDVRIKLSNAQYVVRLFTSFSFATTMYNMAISGEDEDGKKHYDKIPEYVRMRNMIIMMPNGKDYVKIPLPYGYSFFYTTGTMAAETIAGRRTAGSAMLFSAQSFQTSFSPMQFAESSTITGSVLRTAMFTIAEPALDIVMNENYFGGEIHRENFPGAVEKPYHMIAKRGTSAPSLYLYKQINELFGGSDYYKAFGGVHPEDLDYMFTWTFGGAGRTLKGSLEAVEDITSGVPVEVGDIPILKSFIGTPNHYFDADEYYKRRAHIRGLHEEYKAKRSAGEKPWTDSKYENVIHLYSRLKNSDNKLKQIRDREQSAREIKDYKTRKIKLEELNKERRKVYQEFNKRFNEKRPDEVFKRKLP